MWCIVDYSILKIGYDVPYSLNRIILCVNIKYHKLERYFHASHYFPHIFNNLISSFTSFNLNKIIMCLKQVIILEGCWIYEISLIMLLWFHFLYAFISLKKFLLLPLDGFLITLNRFAEVKSIIEYRSHLSLSS